jgi:hypothetical protein
MKTKKEVPQTLEGGPPDTRLSNERKASFSWQAENDVHLDSPLRSAARGGDGSALHSAATAIHLATCSSTGASPETILRLRFYNLDVNGESTGYIELQQVLPGAILS